MNVYTLAARETVREIRESLSRQEPTLETLKDDIDRAVVRLRAATWPIDGQPNYETMELWARLAADLAGMIQQKEKAL